MRCTSCGSEAKGRIVFEMWHAGDRPGFGGYVLKVGAWSCGAHPLPTPSAEEGRYIVQRFHLARMPPPVSFRLVPGFLAMTEDEGRRLEVDPEAVYRKQVEGTIIIEHCSDEDWRRLQREVRARDALIAAAKGQRGGTLGRPAPVLRAIAGGRR